MSTKHSSPPVSDASRTRAPAIVPLEEIESRAPGTSRKLVTNVLRALYGTVFEKPQKWPSIVAVISEKRDSVQIARRDELWPWLAQNERHDLATECRTHLLGSDQVLALLEGLPGTSAFFVVLPMTTKKGSVCDG